MANRIVFTDPITIQSVEGEVMKGVVLPGGWVAHLIPGRPGNRLNCFYHREMLTPDAEGNIEMEDGIYETEIARDIGPHRIAFEVTRGGALGWVSSITLSKETAMDRIARALTSGSR